MQDRRARAKKDPDSPPQVGESILESPGKVVVTHTDTPPRKPAGKKLHPRRPLPLVPTGPSRGTDDEKQQD